MTTLLELPDVRQRVHLTSVEDYHRLGEIGMLSEDVELLRGIVVKKMPKSPLHELVAHKLMKLLLRLMPNGFEVRREGPLTLRNSEPEPDLSIVWGRPEDWAKSHPATAHLVIEIAVSSVALDENKAEIYAEADIPEYWLVRAEDRSVDVYREPTRDGYLSKITLSCNEVLRSESIPGVVLPVSDFLSTPS